ncbi:cell division protein FtsL [Peribacillus sp. SCS-155]|uniref:cell division protein FtsL n=1 Tax=Peribacillus sedimenti TaxID=3115297 RepID=UPI003905EEEF
MSSIAKRLQEQQEAVKQETVQTTVMVRKGKITFGELVLLCVIALMVTAFSIKIVSNQSAIYETNKEIQKVEASIDNQTKVNNDLSVQVSELSTYERIWKKAAELGLMLNENNVKVVQE